MVDSSAERVPEGAAIGVGGRIRSASKSARMESRAARVEQQFVVPTTIATLMVIPVMILQGVDVGAPWRTLGYIGDIAIWSTFLAEVVGVLRVTDDKWGWVKRHPLDVAIVVLTPPVPGNVLDSVRVLRLFRLVRLFRLAPLVRGVFTIEGVKYVSFLALLTLLAGAQAFASIESESVDDGLYWAIGTMTTAGSGDTTADEPAAQIVGAILMVVGLAFAAVLTGAVAQRFIATEDTVTAGDMQSLAKEDALHAKLDAVTIRLDQIEAMLSNATPRDQQ